VDEDDDELPDEPDPLPDELVVEVADVEPPLSLLDDELLALSFDAAALSLLPSLDEPVVDPPDERLSVR
jgi:hypothetical protein